ncbi:hypothetical protein MAM1_0040d02869 [Mucor ambiguus]|uniref:Uncharacterized protein n=1 Tax=Mucor ambiguus TaxID=91626 RepID=A0A0C9M3A5_9FUNG|nr:hypothetical protein MAM1_0040d02869 [Mucor ambiguus]
MQFKIPINNAMHSKDLPIFAKGLSKLLNVDHFGSAVSNIHISNNNLHASGFTRNKFKINNPSSKTSTYTILRILTVK